MKQTLFLASLVAASLVAAMTMAPLLASAVSAITSASISSSATSLDAKITTEGKVAKNGHDGAFGYGVLTLSGFGGVGDSLMVSTTHQGVLDSAKQGGDANSPAWHNHYVQLNTVGVPADCAPNSNLGGASVEVAALTFESPGKAKVNQNVIQLLNMPSTFSGTNALTGLPITMTPGTTASAVVSFTLHPLFNGPGGSLSNVCVENVTPVAAT